MEYIISGATKIPVLGLGTWKLGGQACEDIVGAALDIGYRHIDTAQIYDNEAEIGNVISSCSIPRSDLFLTTKVWIDRLHDGAFQQSVDQSLEKLKTDYVDLLLIHWPVTDVPFAEQMHALASVKDSGKARLIGVSNFTVSQMREVKENLGTDIVNNQVEYHPLLSQQAVLNFTRSHDMFITAYSPLARGNLGEDSTLQRIAGKHGKDAHQVALRWLLQHGDVVAIPKAGNIKHLKSNFDIFDFVLSHDDMMDIHALARPNGRLTNPAWSPVWDETA